MWNGHEVSRVATQEGFASDPELVLSFYAERREVLASARPNEGHRAMVQLQARLGPERIVLVTQNVDGLLQRAAREEGIGLDLIEMHGSIWRERCSVNAFHPKLTTEFGVRVRPGSCAVCGGQLRPDVVWVGEEPYELDRIQGDVIRSHHFVAVGTSGAVYPAAGFVTLAKFTGSTCTEINPEPTSTRFHHVVAQKAETALPALLMAWT